MPKNFIEIEGTGKCVKNRNKKHRFVLISFPNPEYWGDRIGESFCEYGCMCCDKKVEVPYEKAQK